MLKAFGVKVPLNHKYYRTREAAELAAKRAARDMLAGNINLVEIVKVSENDCMFY